VDTQKTLPSGTPEEVYDRVRRRIDIFGEIGGSVFNTIRHLQAKTPVENSFHDEGDSDLLLKSGRGTHVYDKYVPGTHGAASHATIRKVQPMEAK